MTLEEIAARIIPYGVKLIAAILIFIVGRWVARKVGNGCKRVMTARQVDPALVNFASNLAYYALLIFVIIAALGQIGIQTASFVAVVGAAGLAIGLAMQGSLSNFAAGVLIIIFRPFRIGDFVEVAGTSGVVESIMIFTTELKTGDKTLRSKVTMISLRDFQRGCSRAWFESYIWGRFAQPTYIVYSRDERTRAAIEDALLQAAREELLTLADRAQRLDPSNCTDPNRCQVIDAAAELASH